MFPKTKNAMFVRLMEVVMLGHVNMEYQQVKEGCEKERERERERERECVKGAEP